MKNAYSVVFSLNPVSLYSLNYLKVVSNAKQKERSKFCSTQMISVRTQQLLVKFKCYNNFLSHNPKTQAAERAETLSILILTTRASPSSKAALLRAGGTVILETVNKIKCCHLHRCKP